MAIRGIVENENFAHWEAPIELFNAANVGGVERSVVAGQVVDHQHDTELRGIAVAEGSRTIGAYPSAFARVATLVLAGLLLPERNMTRRP